MKRTLLDLQKAGKLKYHPIMKIKYQFDQKMSLLVLQNVLYCTCICNLFFSTGIFLENYKTCPSFQVLSYVCLKTYFIVTSIL